jgi:hypothetical protein
MTRAEAVGDVSHSFWWPTGLLGSRRGEFELVVAFGRAVSAAMVLGTEVSPAPFQEAEAGRQSPCLALRVPPHQRLDNDNLNHGESTSVERGNSEHDSGWPSNAFPLRTASLRAGLGDITTERLAYPRAPQFRHRPPAPRPAIPPNWPNASSPSTRDKLHSKSSRRRQGTFRCSTATTLAPNRSVRSPASLDPPENCPDPSHRIPRQSNRAPC